MGTIKSMNDKNRPRKWTIIDNETLNKCEIEASLNDMNKGLDVARRRPLYIILEFAIGALLVFFSVMTTFVIVSPKSAKLTYENDSLRQSLAICQEELELYASHEHDIYCLIGEYSLIRSKEVPNPDSLAAFAVKIGLWYPEIAIAQYIQESSLGKSNLYKNSNNLCGMKTCFVRPTTQCGEYNGYGKYRNWQMCVLDTWLWERFSFSNKKPSFEEYLEKLGDTYAEDEMYVEHLRSHISSGKIKIPTDSIKNNTLE